MFWNFFLVRLYILYIFRKALTTDLYHPELEYWTTNPNIMLVAKSNKSGKVLGMISYRQISHDTVEMHRLAVDSTKRGFGIGKKLIMKLEGKAVEEDFTYMYLETTNVEKGPWKMYEKYGYQFLRFKNFDASPLLQMITGSNVLSYIKKLK